MGKESSSRDRGHWQQVRVGAAGVGVDVNTSSCPEGAGKVTLEDDVHRVVDIAGADLVDIIWDKKISCGV